MKRKLDTGIQTNTQTNINDNSFPPELVQYISNFLTVKDANRWSMCQWGYYSLFRNSTFYLSRFLTCVARGEQDEAQIFLKINPALMIQKGWVADNSRRVFYTSAFKYLLGALDTRYMFNMFIKCLREDTQYSLHKKKEIAEELLKQYEEFEKEGIDYTLDDVGYKNQVHFGFTPLLEALKIYQEKVPHYSHEERTKFFNTEVGNAQFLVPAHLAQHYCDSDVPFDPKPTFTAETFKRCLDIKNDKGVITHTWWSTDGERVLGQHFAYVGCGGPVQRAAGVREQLDLQAVTALYEKRLEDKLAIKATLEALIQEFGQGLELQAPRQ